MNANHIERYSWAEHEPLMRDYHDSEWGMPDTDSRSIWECLVLEGFQAGLAWVIVLRKREAFRAAFKQFSPEAVARFTEKDVDRLLLDPGIIRSRAKIDATIQSARIYLDMQQSGMNFSDWVWSFVDGKPIQNSGSVPASTPLAERISKELKHRGIKFVGPIIVYAWMQAIGLVNDHAPNCFRRELCASKIQRM
jgi:DNA-3-methyladenine glycosylase I